MAQIVCQFTVLECRIVPRLLRTIGWGGDVRVRYIVHCIVAIAPAKSRSGRSSTEYVLVSPFWNISDATVGGGELAYAISPLESLLCAMGRRGSYPNRDEGN